MIVTSRPFRQPRPIVRSEIGWRSVRLPGWRVSLAAVGTGSAESTLGESELSLVLSERPPASWAGSVLHLGGPVVELQLATDGRVVAQCREAPPVLLMHACSDPVQPLPADRARSARTVRAGELLFACTPSLLDTLDPAEVTAAPKLLWMSAEPQSLLVRWIQAAARFGIGGAAAAVARYVGVDGPSGA